jgi:cytochrome c oxidase subunit 4
MSDAHAHDHSSAGHVLPLKMLFGTFLALLALTAFTVWTGKMDLHGFDLGVAMIIATVKAILVTLIFMHLKWDRPFNGFVFLIAVLFAGVFLAYVLTDTTSYQNDIKGWTDDNISHPATE